MVSDYRDIRPRGSPRIPQSPSYGYLTEQARFGISMGPELGRNPHQNFQGDHPQQSPHPFFLPHFQSPHPYPPIHPHPHPHPRSLPSPYAHDMHEAIQREIEKEQIREEIMLSEIMRRRELEAEVRRELMMESELALWRGRDEIPFALPSVTWFDFTMRLPHLGTRAEGMSMEERTSSLRDRERLNVRREIGGLEPLPFQKGSTDVRVSEAKPVSEMSKEQKIILLAKPNDYTSGVKREASDFDPPSDGHIMKRAKEEWSCALCQVSTTSERALNEHLQGKKHKRKEAALEVQKVGKNYSIGLFPKKAQTAQFLETDVGPSADTEEKVKIESLPFHVTKADGSKKNEVPVNILEGNIPKKRKVQKVRKTYSIGLFPKKVQTAQVLETDVGPSADSEEKVKIEPLPFNVKKADGSKNEVPVNILKGDVPKKRKVQKVGKNYSIGLFSMKEQTAQVLETDVGPSADSEEKVKIESLPDVTKADGSKKNEVPINITKKRKFKHWCELCQVGCPSQKVLNNHIKGRRHGRRLEMSKKNCGSGPSDEKGGPVDENIAGDGGAAYELGEDTTVGGGVGAKHKPLDGVSLPGDGAALKLVEEETVAKDGKAVAATEQVDDLTKPDMADELRDNEQLLS